MFSSGMQYRARTPCAIPEPDVINIQAGLNNIEIQFSWCLHHNEIIDYNSRG